MSNLIIQNKVKPGISKLLNFQDMIDARIITKNLVYIIGLSPKIANKELLMKYEYLAQFGKIIKIVVNKNKAYNSNNPKGPSYSAYVTYSKPSEASIAILALDSCVVDDHMVRASFGTTKYCTFYLKHQECPNRDCLFLHSLAEEADIISRDDLNFNKNIFMDQQVYAMKIADIFNADVKRKIYSSINKKIKSVFPSPDSLYLKDIVKKNDVIHNNNSNFNNNNQITANPANTVSLNCGTSNTITNSSPIAINNSSVNNNNFSNTKKKYFEDDTNVINNNAINGKNGFPSKNKKVLGKLQYREKIISSSINNVNANDSNKTENDKCDSFENCLEIEKNKIKGIKGNHVIGSRSVHEADINSHETTSTSSKDDNFIALNKQGGIMLNKKDDHNFGELIDIMKFNSGKLNSLNNLTNSDNYSCKDINCTNFNSTNSENISTSYNRNNSSKISNLFSCRNNSRFDFVNRINDNKTNSNNEKDTNYKEEKSDENVEIPNFVLDIIKKKVSRQMFTKKFEFIEDILYHDDLLQKEYINENHWAEFIVDNKMIDTDKELIFDFDVINKSLKDKFKTYYLK